MQLGNPEAPVQIMVACNPYCGPCAKAHELLHTLTEKYTGLLGLTIRFTLAADNKKDKRTEVVQYVLQHIEEACVNKTPEEKSAYSRKVLQHWFTQMNYEKFTARFSNTKTIDVSSILQQHENWSRLSSIRFTPTIFINGRELPEGYTITDIDGLMNVLPGILESELIENKPGVVFV